MTYTGTIVEESLLDNRIINEFDVLDARISNAENPVDRWHLYKVEATPEQIDILSKCLKPNGWYTHFWQDDKIIVVFPGKKFEINHADKDTWHDAITYGQRIGIPMEQLDFPVDGS